MPIAHTSYNRRRMDRERLMRSLLRKTSIICTLIIFFSGINAFANEDPAKLIYLTENFPPFNYIENDELKGFSVELLKLIWKELGVKPQKIEIYPWSVGRPSYLHIYMQSISGYPSGAWTPLTY